MYIFDSISVSFKEIINLETILIILRKTKERLPYVQVTIIKISREKL